MSREININLRSYSLGDVEPLSNFLKEFLPSLNLMEKKQILTEAAMLACKYGNFVNLELIIQHDITILREKECGIFRMSAEIDSFVNFKRIINTLMKPEYKKYINFNSYDSAFLKECIKKNKFNYIEYMIEEKGINFELNNNNLIKTLVRNENKDMFEYFVFNLNIPIEERLQNWFLENNYENQWSQINKRNLFIKLDKKLKNKHILSKVNKL